MQGPATILAAWCSCGGTHDERQERSELLATSRRAKCRLSINTPFDGQSNFSSEEADWVKAALGFPPSGST